MPVRVQQRRTRGWRKPENTVSVARPGRWGNPYQVQAVRARGPFDVWLGGWFCGQSTDEAGARRIAVDRFRRAILAGHHGLSVVEAREQLAGKNLMCFCPLDQPCHADVLLELANPAPLCPECRDGKCRNCVGEALNGDDELVPCGCPNHKETTC